MTSSVLATCPFWAHELLVFWSLAPHTFLFLSYPPISSGPVHSRPFQMPLTVFSLTSIISSGAGTASFFNLFLFNSRWKTSRGTGLKISRSEIYINSFLLFSLRVEFFFSFYIVGGLRIILEGHQGQATLLRTKAAVLWIFVRLLLGVM